MIDEDKKMSAHNIRLTSAEIGQLWSSYMSESMAICTLGYFLGKVEDSEIRPIVEYALSLSKKHVKVIADILKHENHPIPIGFTQEDVNVEAPRLFSDTLILNYMRQMSKIGLASYGFALPMCARSDVRDYFSECITSSVELYNRSVEVMLSKGTLARAPYIPVPERVDFVTKQGFMSGFLGKKRPLMASEIASLWFNSETNALGKAVVMGFSQVAKSPEVRAYMVRGREIAKKAIEVFHGVLNEENIPSPSTWDTDVMRTTVAPFSDKLMMFHVSALSQSGMGNYGVAASSSMRRDLPLMYSRLAAEAATFADDGLGLMIDQGWLEEPPHAFDSDALTRV